MDSDRLCADNTRETTPKNNVSRFDKVFCVFFKKYERGIFAYDVPCQHQNTRKMEMQCRAADELQTMRFYCLDCETYIE